MTRPARDRTILRGMTESRLRCIDRDHEAASGDLLDDGAEPVFVSQRATGEDVLVLHARMEGRRLVCDVRHVAEGLELDDVVALFVRTYLGTLTGGSLRKDVDEVVLRGGPGGRDAVFPFPSDAVLFG